MHLRHPHHQQEGVKTNIKTIKRFVLLIILAYCCRVDSCWKGENQIFAPSCDVRCGWLVAIIGIRISIGYIHVLSCLVRFTCFPSTDNLPFVILWSYYWNEEWLMFGNNCHQDGGRWLLLLSVKTLDIYRDGRRRQVLPEVWLNWKFITVRNYERKVQWKGKYWNRLNYVRVIIFWTILIRSFKLLNSLI